MTAIFCFLAGDAFWKLRTTQTITSAPTPVIKAESEKRLEPLELQQFNQKITWPQTLSAPSAAISTSKTTPAFLDKSRSSPFNLEFLPLETPSQFSSEARSLPQLLVTTGTLINVVLTQDLISDYLGPWRGMLTHDVYDQSKTYIIFPKGSHVIGHTKRITNTNEVIQGRLSLVIQRVILPNGTSLDLKENSSVLDRTGVAAIKDQVDHHLSVQLFGVAAYTLIGQQTPYIKDPLHHSYQQEIQTNLKNQFRPLVNKYLNVVPTVKIQAGTPLKIFLTEELRCSPWRPIFHSLYEAPS